MNMLQQDFISYLKNLKPEDWNRQVTSRWTVKEVVAHMVGWERDDPEAIRKAWETREAPWWLKTNDYNEYNYRNVEFYKDFSPAQLIAEWEKWQQKVQEEIERIGESNLKLYPELFGWLFEGPEGFKDSNHYNYHLRQIKNAVENRFSTTAQGGPPLEH